MNTPSRTNSNNRAITIMITATSIAAAMTGWAIFANKDNGTDTVQAAVVAEVPAATDFKPLPTLVPLIGTTPQPTAPAARTQTQAQVQPQQSLPTAQAPSVQQPAARSVSPAPRPLTRSRSSR